MGTERWAEEKGRERMVGRWAQEEGGSKARGDVSQRDRLCGALAGCRRLPGAPRQEGIFFEK